MEQDVFAKQLGDLIRERRKMSNLSQTAVAQAVGVYQASVSSWENGKAAPGLRTILALSKLFGYDLTTFWDDIDE
jgi:transcriptional regulator with XRE-family HTH domain